MCHEAYVLPSWRRQSAARENTNPKIHVSPLSVIYGKRTRKRTDLKMRGKHAIEHVFRIAALVALSNISLPKLPRISTKFANAVVNFCHNGWRRNFSRLLPRRRINLRFSRPFVPFERIIKRRYENSHYKQLSSFAYLFFSLPPLPRFYEVRRACCTRSLVHRINAPLCKAANFHTPLVHGFRNYAKYTAYQLDIPRCYKTPFRVLARSF